MEGGHGMRILWRWGAHAHMGRDARSDVARRVVVKTGVSVGGMVYVYCGGRGNLRVAKTQPLQSAFAGTSLRGIAAPTTIYAHAGIYGKAERQITTRHAASL